MAAEKILNTGHALYPKMAVVYAADTHLPTMRNLKGASDLPIQGINNVLSQEVPAGINGTQGIATDGAHWYQMDSGAIYKKDFVTGAVVASRLDPFVGMPAAVNHCGDGFVKDGLLYVPCVDSDPSIQYPTDQRIGVYNTSDLSTNKIYDTSIIDPDFGGSGLGLAPNGNIYGVTFYNLPDPSALNKKRQHTIWEFDINTGALVDLHTTDRPILGGQGITWDGTHYLIPSWAITTSNIVRLNSKFEYVDEIDLTGNLGTHEIEGVEYFNGKYYAHDINTNAREFDVKGLYMHPGRSTPVKIVPYAQLPDTGSIAMTIHVATFVSFRQVFDSEEIQTGWNSWISDTGELAWRLSTADTLRYTLPSTFTDYNLYYSWERSGASVTLKMGVNGVIVATATTAWVDKPAGGLWIGGKHPLHDPSNYIYRDIFAFNDVLTLAELLELHNNPTAMYSPEVLNSTLNISDPKIPDGTYLTDVYNTVTENGYKENVTFTGGNASIAATNITSGTKMWGLIEGPNPPVTGIAWVGVTE